jgi:Fe-Mn family superoxide dismutase
MYTNCMFTEQKFQIPNLEGISTKTIEEHLKLYVGYVTHSNAVLEKIEELSNPPTGGAEKNMPILSGLQRRFSFEYNGMRNHEVYFSTLEGGPNDDAPTLIRQIENQWGSFENWLSLFKAIATTRGVGWAMLYYDRKENKLLNAWIDEQHFGQLQDCTLVLALDMWEHSYVADYQPSGKKQYIEDFFKNLNWSVAEKYFLDAQNK